MSIKNKLKYIGFALILLLPFWIQYQSCCAIGISGLGIGEKGDITVDESNIKVNKDGAKSISSGTKKLSGRATIFLKKNRFLMMAFSGVCTILIGAYWVLQIVRFANSNSSPQARKEAISNLIFLGVATAMLTGLTFFTSFATGLLG